MRYDLPTEVSVRNEAVIQQVMNDTVKRPAARVEFVPYGGTGIDLEFVSFAINQQSGTTDSFTVTFTGTEAFWESWQMRAIASGGRGDRFNFFVTFAGQEFKIFEGFPDGRKDTWPPPEPGPDGWKGGDDPVTLSGLGLLGLLRTVSGAYCGAGDEPIPYTGFLLDLIRYFPSKAGLGRAIIDFGVGYGSWRVTEPREVAYSDGFQAFTAIVRNIYPAALIWITRGGQVRARMRRPNSYDKSIFNYSDVYEEEEKGKARIMAFERTWRISDVITRCMIIWSDGAKVVEDSSLKVKFGLKTHTVDLPWITHEWDAYNAAQGIITEYNRWQVGITATINPYLEIGSVIRIHPRLGRSAAAKSVEVIGRAINISIKEGAVSMDERLTCRALEEGQAWA